MNQAPMMNDKAASVQGASNRVAMTGGVAPHLLVDGVKRVKAEMSSSLTGGVAPHLLVDGVKRVKAELSAFTGGVAPHLLVDGVKASRAAA
jgi:hypothetical protein